MPWLDTVGWARGRYGRYNYRREEQRNVIVALAATLGVSLTVAASLLRAGLEQESRKRHRPKNGRS
jgi:hypothetical protein